MGEQDKLQHCEPAPDELTQNPLTSVECMIVANDVSEI